MPIYEFICRDCQTPFEKLMPASQRDRAVCAHCGSECTARKISLASPAQVRADSASVSSEGCEMPSCCGGGCGMPN